MVVYTYYDMIYGVSNYPTVAPLYCFVISNKNGDYIAYGFLTISNEGGENKVITTMNWYGDYERLNSNYNHIYYHLIRKLLVFLNLLPLS